MYNLETAIKAWRQDLQKSGVDPDSIEEIESHLRDSIDDQVASGSTVEEAFHTAVSQIGGTRDLAREFRKIDDLPLADKISLTTLGILALFATVGLFSTMGMNRGNADPINLVHVITVIIGFLGLFFIFWLGAYCVIRRLFTIEAEAALYRCLRRIVVPLSLGGMLITIFGTVCGSIWLYQRHGVIWDGSEKEFGCLLVMAWYLAALTFIKRDHRSITHLPLALLSAGVLVHFSWFVLGGMPFTIISIITGIIIAEFSILGLVQSRQWWRERMAT